MSVSNGFHRSRRYLLAATLALILPTCNLVFDLDGLVGVSPSDDAGIGEEPFHELADANVGLEANVSPDATDAADGGEFDASPSDAALPALIQSSSRYLTGSFTSMESSPLNSVSAGDLLVVVFQFTTPVAVASMTDDAPGDAGPANTYVSANQTAWINCGAASDTYHNVWYARMVRGGARRVTATISSGSTVQYPAMWVLDFSGVGTFDRGGTISTQSAASLITSPQLSSTSEQAVIVSTGISCRNVVGVHSGNPFMLLPVLAGNAVGYHIAPKPGVYGALFDTDEAVEWAASTVIFR